MLGTKCKQTAILVSVQSTKNMIGVTKKWIIKTMLFNPVIYTLWQPPWNFSFSFSCSRCSATHSFAYIWCFIQFFPFYIFLFKFVSTPKLPRQCCELPVVHQLKLKICVDLSCRIFGNSANWKENGDKTGSWQKIIEESTNFKSWICYTKSCWYRILHCDDICDWINVAGGLFCFHIYILASKIFT